MGGQSVINPFDTYAMEEAVRLKEKLGGTVCALSMGIPAVERLLREAMSRGVDSALLLSDRPLPAPIRWPPPTPFPWACAIWGF